MSKFRWDTLYNSTHIFNDHTVIFHLSEHCYEHRCPLFVDMMTSVILRRHRRRPKVKISTTHVIVNARCRLITLHPPSDPEDFNGAGVKDGGPSGPLHLPIAISSKWGIRMRHFRRKNICISFSANNRFRPTFSKRLITVFAENNIFPS